MRTCFTFAFLIVSLLVFGQQSISVCSFNIKFLGLYKKKDHAALAQFLTPYDLVVIQELVSPPVRGVFPNGEPYEADEEARLFHEEMMARDFDFVLSVEDTGTGDNIHSNASSTEWFIAYFKPQVVQRDTSLYTQFLASDRSNHPSYERVPHAFSFRTADGGLDFTLISVHLKPDNGTDDRARRKEELTAIYEWIDENDEHEKDFLIVGDMNIYSRTELDDVLPPGYRSLNDHCETTTMAQEVRPYDHVMYDTALTGTEIGGWQVVDLIETMRPYWQGLGVYPEHDKNLFYQYYSDHHPVVFKLVSDGTDDD